MHLAIDSLRVYSPRRTLTNTGAFGAAQDSGTTKTQVSEAK